MLPKEFWGFFVFIIYLEVFQMSTPVYMDEREVSKLTKRAVNTLRADRHYGRGIPYRKLNRKVIYRLDEVIDYIEGRKIETVDSI